MIEIIAEIGINHNGNFNWIEELIRQAKIGGANLAKFQLYNSRKLFGDDSRKKYELSFDDVCVIKKLCDIYDIEFMASVFDTERLDWCEKIGIRRYKIASRTLAKDHELCKNIIRLDKPVIASTGMCNTIPEFCLDYKNIKFLWCISKYPTSIFDLNKQIYFKDWIVGLSDHSYGIGYALWAIAHGAKIVEKHFTLNKSLNGNDHIGSMDLEELNCLRKYGSEIGRINQPISGKTYGL